MFGAVQVGADAIQVGADLYCVPLIRIERVFGCLHGYLRYAIVYDNASPKFCFVALGEVDYVKMHWNLTLYATDDNCVGKLVA